MFNRVLIVELKVKHNIFPLESYLIENIKKIPICKKYTQLIIGVYAFRQFIQRHINRRVNLAQRYHVGYNTFISF